MVETFEEWNTVADPFVSEVVAQQGGAVYPEFSGEIGPTMSYRGREFLIWNLNNYLGLASDPEVRRVDALLGRADTVLYDAHCHACILDGVRLHRGPRFSFPHNDIDRLEFLLGRVDPRERRRVLVISEGVFGMSGTKGRLDRLTELRAEYGFRLLVDDAHGFGTMGPQGAGAGAAAGVQDGIDLYFGTFAKAAASIGAFVTGASETLGTLRHQLRSQIFSKGLPTAIVAGNRTRLQLIRRLDDRRAQLWTTARSLRRGLTDNGFDIGGAKTPITPVYLNGSVGDAIRFTDRLRDEHDIFLSFVVYPVVPRGVVQLRIVPTSLHTVADAERTVAALVAVRAAESPPLGMKQ